MGTMYVTRGLPASGKSTRAREMMKQNKALRSVSKDDIRKLLYPDGKWNPIREELVISTQDVIIAHLVEKGFDIVVHDTSLNPDVFTRLKHMAQELKYDFEVIDTTNVPIEVCIQRDSLREFSVGHRVILNMAQDYLPEHYARFRERYPDEESILRMVYNHKIKPYDANKISAVVVDIDGTLAFKGDRNPYDYTRVHLDLINAPLAHIIIDLAEFYQIIFVSGRDEECCEETKAWLAQHGLWDGKAILHMRKHNDNRADWRVKEEIYFQEIEHSYNIFMWYDDRKQVVSHMRSLGLPVAQVYWGDF